MGDIIHNVLRGTYPSVFGRKEAGWWRAYRVPLSIKPKNDEQNNCGFRAGGLATCGIVPLAAAGSELACRGAPKMKFGWSDSVGPCWDRVLVSVSTAGRTKPANLKPLTESSCPDGLLHGERVSLHIHRGYGVDAGSALSAMVCRGGAI